MACAQVCDLVVRIRERELSRRDLNESRRNRYTRPWNRGRGFDGCRRLGREVDDFNRSGSRVRGEGNHKLIVSYGVELTSGHGDVSDGVALGCPWCGHYK